MLSGKVSIRGAGPWKEYRMSSLSEESPEVMDSSSDTSGMSSFTESDFLTTKLSSFSVKKKFDVGVRTLGGKKENFPVSSSFRIIYFGSSISPFISTIFFRRVVLCLDAVIVSRSGTLPVLPDLIWCGNVNG